MCNYLTVHLRKTSTIFETNEIQIRLLLQKNLNKKKKVKIIERRRKAEHDNNDEQEEEA